MFKISKSEYISKPVISENIIFVFRPAGWDSMKKIGILYENMQSCRPDDYYRDVITQPAIRKVSDIVIVLMVRLYAFPGLYPHSL